MRSYLILSMCVLFLFQYFLNFVWLEYIVVSMAILAFIASAAKSKGFPRMVGFVMMGTGVILEFYKGAAIEGISQGLMLIMPLLCLVTLAPLLSIPLKLGGYFESVDSMLRNLLHHPKRLFAGITASLFILSPILSLGSVRILDEFLADLKLPRLMSAKSYLVGFSTAIMWSPYFASVSLVLYYLNMPVGKYILYGIGLSFVSLLVGNLLFVIWEKRHPIDRDVMPEAPLQTKDRKQLFQLALLIVGLISFSLFLEYVTKWSMIIIVCLFSIFLPVLWATITNGWKRLYPQWKTYKDQSVPMMNNEIMLFSSAGLFSHAIQGTSLANKVSAMLTEIASLSFLLFALAVMAIVLILTYIGLHQMAVIAALAMQLNPDELGISTLALAMLLLLCWSVSTPLSPFSGLNLMVSRILGTSGYEIGVRANGMHLTIISIIGIGIIMLFR